MPRQGKPPGRGVTLACDIWLRWQSSAHGHSQHRQLVLEGDLSAATSALWNMLLLRPNYLNTNVAVSSETGSKERSGHERRFYFLYFYISHFLSFFFLAFYFLKLGLLVDALPSLGQET